MDKSLFIAVRAAIVIGLCAFIATSTHASDVNSSYTEVSKSDLKQRIESLHSEVDLRYTDEIHTIIDTYIKGYRKGSTRLLSLSERYFPLYEAELSQRGLPQELKYLSVIESSLKPTALSSSGASGLWQFMKGTGKLYGLSINSAVDERRDPIRSTQAASRYLADLYDQFGDWTLALAAYNCGPGNVRKALRRSQEESFWSLKRRGYLPRETRHYIPKYVAMSYLMNFSHMHDLYAEYQNLESYATVQVYDYRTFSEISRITGLSKGEIAELNPAFVKGYIPRNSQGYYLTLPQEELYMFLAEVGGFENLLDLGYDSSKLRGRYILYRATRKKLAAVEALSEQRFSHTITSHDGRQGPGRMKSQIVHAAVPSQSMVYHRLEPQETMEDIARDFDMSLSALLKLNKIDPKKPSHPGSTIRVK